MNLIDKISFVLLLMVDDDQEEQFVNNMLNLNERLFVFLIRNKKVELTKFFLIDF
jgi:hypothetical protein